MGHGSLWSGAGSEESPAPTTPVPDEAIACRPAGGVVIAYPDSPSEFCPFGIFIMNLDKKICVLNLWESK